MKENSRTRVPHTQTQSVKKHGDAYHPIFVFTKGEYREKDHQYILRLLTCVILSK